MSCPPIGYGMREMERKARRATGTGEGSRNTNTRLDTMLQEAYKARKILMDNDYDITAEGIKNQMLGIDDRKLILEVFRTTMTRSPPCSARVFARHA